ncbi:MAG: LemA family protein [Nanoarchaeota archaeon]
METNTLIWIGAGVIGAGALFLSIKGWITVYNKFIYWRNKLDEKFAGIDVIMQRRIDMLPALAQVAKKYSIHEYKTIKDTIEARSRWTKDKSLNEKVKAVDEIENNFIKIQAVFERYPKVKADKLYQQIMGSGNITRIERKLQQFRLTYNKVVREYNERVQMFPRNIVAKVHGFKTANYLTLGNKINQENQETYKPKELFNE